MSMAGQTINDRLLAARHSLAGQGLAKSVCKATTEELIGPKKKHLDCKFFISFLISQNFINFIEKSLYKLNINSYYVDEMTCCATVVYLLYITIEKKYTNAAEMIQTTFRFLSFQKSERVCSEKLVI